YYRVRAQNAAGTSAYSNTASATTSGGSAPAAPSNVAAGQSSVSPASQINVYWQHTSSNETGFEIFRSSDNVTFSQIATVGPNVTEYDDPGLASGTRYYYYVKAYNANGTSAASNTDGTITAGTSGVPAAPSALAATAVSSTGINLTWTNNSPTATAMLVENSTNNVTFTQIASLAGNAAAYSNTGLTAGTLYYYRVRAQNAAGTSAYSNTASATALSLPAAPSALAATAVSSTGINLTWTNNSPTATAMLVENSTNNVTFTQIASLAGNAAAYSNTGLTAGTLYYYRVRAQNAAGTSAYSNTASATALSLPAAPSALAATAVSSTGINLTWTNNSPTAAAMLVENSTNNVTFTQIASLAGNAAAYSNTGLTAGTLYYYRVRAQNAAGTSAYSNTASATALSLPAAPSALAATAVSSTGINLTWTNNSPTATAMLVENSTNNVTFTQIASLAGNADAYSNTGLTAGTLY